MVFTLIILGSILVLLISAGLLYAIYRRGAMIRQQKALQLEWEQKVKQMAEEALHRQYKFNEALMARDEVLNMVSKELHNEIGPLLSIIKLQTNALPRKIKNINEIEPQTKVISELITGAIENVRDISSKLTFPAGTNSELVAAIEALAEDVTSATGIHVVFVSECNVNVPGGKEWQVSVYQFIKDILQFSVTYNLPEHIELILGMSAQKIWIKYNVTSGRPVLSGDLTLQAVAAYEIKKLKDRILLFEGDLIMETISENEISLLIDFTSKVF